MKKILILAFCIQFFLTGIAGATDFTLTGSYFARGTWFDNKEGTGIDSVNSKNQYGVYDHEMSLDATWKISPETKVSARFEIRDEDWAVATNATEASTSSRPDSNIYVEHVWGQYDFIDAKVRVKAGLVGTGDWATEFGNQGGDAYRVMVAKLTEYGYVIAFTEKPQTITPFFPSETLGEDADIDTYWLGFITKIGELNFLPSFGYTQSEAQLLDAGIFITEIGLNGTFGTIGFEAEFIYQDYNYDDSTSDFNVWGVYANVWAHMNALKVGTFIAHGSYDEDTNNAFEFGDDFDGGGALLLGDELLLYDSSMGLSYEDLQAVTLLAVYGSYTATEKLTLGVYAGYADSNVDIPGNKYDGASAWEVNVIGEYKISQNLTYSAGAAIAQVEYGNNDPDPDKAVEVFHKLSFSF